MRTAPAPTPPRRNTALQASIQAGLVFGERGDWEAASRSYAKATRLAPRDALGWVHLANASLRLQRIEDAARAAERALALEPGHVAAALLLAQCRRIQRRWGDACDAIGPAIASLDVDGLTSHAESLYRAGRHEAALEAAMGVLARRIDHAPAHAWMGFAFQKLGMPGEAVECMRTANRLAPQDAVSLAWAIAFAQESCRWEGMAEDLARLTDLLDGDAAAPPVPFNLLMMDLPAATRVRTNRRYAATLTAPPLDRGQAGPVVGAGGIAHEHDARVSIGYLSSDFHNHATSVLLAEVLERHDRGRVRVALYSCGPDDGSAMRRRLEAATERFVDLCGLDDEAAARRIRDDGVEILVDLKGYTFDHRIGIVARRPAPVQVSWLGYPSTTGHEALDYFIGDPVVTPPGSEHQYTEKLALMPHCYQPNDRKRGIDAAPSRAECGLPDDAFVFCCFNVPQKITPRLFDLWCDLLRRIPAAVLWLLAPSAAARDNLQREAAARGIGADRIVFAPKLPLARHLARVGLADLFLDTLPCNAHTTASDALWAGVPVLTCAGDHFTSRVAASLLHAVGLPDLVTADLDGYAAMAMSLATDRARLRAIRARLEAARQDAPLFDSAAFARDLEALYGRMAARHRAGLAPAHLWPEAPTVRRDTVAAPAQADAPADR